MKLNEQPDQDEHQLEDDAGDPGRAGRPPVQQDTADAQHANTADDRSIKANSAATNQEASSHHATAHQIAPACLKSSIWGPRLLIRKENELCTISHS